MDRRFWEALAMALLANAMALFMAAAIWLGG